MKKLILTLTLTVTSFINMNAQEWGGATTSLNGEIFRDGNVRLRNSDLTVFGNQRIGFDTQDSYTLQGFTIAHYGLTRSNNEITLSGYGGINFNTRGNTHLAISGGFNGSSIGFVGIGTLNPTERLTVNGNILAEEVRVIQDVPADYVFEKYFQGISELKPEYKMPTLEEVEAFTKLNNHLPDMPSAAEIQENGLELSEMTNLLLQKIEELTIYTIEQEKRIEALENQLRESQTETNSPESIETNEDSNQVSQD